MLKIIITAKSSSVTRFQTGYVNGPEVPGRTFTLHRNGLNGRNLWLDMPRMFLKARGKARRTNVPVSMLAIDLSDCLRGKLILNDLV